MNHVSVCAYTSTAYMLRVFVHLYFNVLYIYIMYLFTYICVCVLVLYDIKPINITILYCPNTPILLNIVYLKKDSLRKTTTKKRFLQGIKIQ